MALADGGGTLAGYAAHTPEGRARAEALLGGDSSPDLVGLVDLDPDLYFLCVPDAAVPDVARELGGVLASARSEQPSTAEPAARPVVAHTSGGTSLRALDPCLQAGADTLVFHPLQTFTEPASGRHRFKGVPIAITADSVGDASRAIAFGFALAALLEAKPFYLKDEDRGLYHAAAAMACNHLVTLENAALQMFVAAGLPTDEALSYFLPLVKTTLENISAQGPAAALTGPLSRGDTQTVAEHLSALHERMPHLLPLYRSLAVATLDLVHTRGDLDNSVLESLAGLLESPVGKHGYRLPTDPATSNAPFQPTQQREGQQR